MTGIEWVRQGTSRSYFYEEDIPRIVLNLKNFDFDTTIVPENDVREYLGLDEVPESVRGYMFKKRA